MRVFCRTHRNTRKQCPTNVYVEKVVGLSYNTCLEQIKSNIIYCYCDLVALMIVAVDTNKQFNTLKACSQ